MNATMRLAEFVVDTRYEALPPGVISRAKHSFIDTLACALVGSADPEGQAIADFVRKMGGEAQSRVLGHQAYLTSASQAAMVNAVMAHVLDYDDTYSTISYKAVSESTDPNDPAVGMTVGHMGACLLPSVLAVGETTKAGGHKVLEAYAAGFEVACRIGHVMGLKHYMKGYHSTSTLGCMAATAAAAKLLELDAQKICMAFGLAAAQASGLRGNFGSMAKSLQAGNAARIGVLAAQLADGGFTANPDIIGAELGYVDVLSLGGARPAEAIEETPEGGYYLLKGNTLKFLPCGNALQSSVEAMLDLIADHDIGAGDVESVEAHLQMPRYRVCTADGVVYERPSTGLEGKFVLPYCLAAAILDRKIDLATFTDTMVQRPEIEALFPKVSLKIDPSAEQEKLSVRLTNGEVRERVIGKSKGHWSQTFPEELLDAKFRDCAGQVLDAGAVDQSLSLARNLETLADIGDLTALASPSS